MLYKKKQPNCLKTTLNHKEVEPWYSWKQSWKDFLKYFIENDIFPKWPYKRSPGSPKPHQVGALMSEGMLCLVSWMKALFVMCILIIPKCRKMDSGICQKCHTGSQRISLNRCHRAHILPLDISIQRFISKEKWKSLWALQKMESPLFDPSSSPAQ